jgi:hypothetical protein
LLKEALNTINHLPSTLLKVTTRGWWRTTPSNDNYYRSF